MTTSSARKVQPPPPIVFPPSALPPPEDTPRDPSVEFGALASALSDRLVALERYLASRPATVHASVIYTGQERDHRLEWMRHNGAWRLWLWDLPRDQEEAEAHTTDEGFVPTAFGGRFLTQASVDDKLDASEHLPELLNRIREGELKKIERLKAVHAKLDKLAAQWPEGT